MMMRACLVVVAIVLGGCAAAPAERPAFVQDDALVGVAGAPLVFAVPGGRGLPDGPVAARLDGRAVPAWVRRVVVEPGTARGDRWLDAAEVWRGAGDEVEAEKALVFVHVEMPTDAASGVLEVAGLRRAVRVWPGAKAEAAPAVMGETEWYDNGAVSASGYWRFALAGMNAGALVDRHPAERAAALALTAQWETALARLEIADRWVAGRVMVALTRTAQVSGERVPAWAADTDADDRLRRELLNETLSHIAAAERARAWLRLQPELVARVRDPASAGVVAVQVTDLSGRGSAASLSDGRRSGASLFLRAFASALLPAPVRGEQDKGDLLIASAGVRSVSLARPVEELVAEPPGARLGPLARDHSMRNWLTNEAVLHDATHATAGLVYRKAHANVWEVYIECKSPRVHANDRVNVWLGPREESVVVATIDRDGVLLLDREHPRVELAAHESREDRWSTTLVIPAEAVSPDGTVLIGLSRTYGDTDDVRRLSWPVALVPWEEEPGRVSISLTDWFRLSP